MSAKRKICVVTTSRSEYGLLSPLIKLIHDDLMLDLQLIVAGSHLSPEYGYTVNEVKENGIAITETIEFLLSSDRGEGVGKSMGLATISFVDSFKRLAPDCLVLLGDRYETLAVAMAATALKIPIAHLHGGEVTKGAIDDNIRHAITKLSHMHFTASSQYRERVLQLGEHPDRVFNVGATGLDSFAIKDLLDQDALSSDLNIQFSSINILCTYQPVTLLPDNGLSGLSHLLLALECIPKASVFFTMPNADVSSLKINKLIDGYVSQSHNRYAFPSLGHYKYLSMAKSVDVVVGNSSSALIEVPFLGTPSVNVGIRQDGRELASSVLTCDDSQDAILGAIRHALSTDFQNQLNRISSPYGNGGASVRIMNILKSIDMSGILRKSFVDDKQYA